MIKNKGIIGVRYLFQLTVILVSILFCYTSCDSKSEAINKGMPHQIDTRLLQNFILNTPTITDSQAILSIDSTLSAAGHDSMLFNETIAFLDKSLSDPNSRYRNEDLSIEVLKAPLHSSWCDSNKKIQARHRLQLALQNRPGAPAND